MTKLVMTKPICFGEANLEEWHSVTSWEASRKTFEDLELYVLRRVPKGTQCSLRPCVSRLPKPALTGRLRGLPLGSPTPSCLDVTQTNHTPAFTSGLYLGNIQED